MNGKPHIYGNRVVTKTQVNDAIGRALSQIKSDDNLTWEEVGVVLGKSEDRAMAYAVGDEMGAYAFLRARHAWGDRFTAAADKLLPAHVDENQIRSVA